MKIKKVALSLSLLTLIISSPLLEAATEKNNDNIEISAAKNELKVDPAKSEVIWKATKVGGEHTGTVNIDKGSLTVDGNKLLGGEFVMDMATIEDTDITNASMNEKLVGHLKSEDFFSVEKHPHSTFKITKAEAIPNAKPGSANYTLTGDLTIKDITHAVTFPAIVNIKGNTAQATARVEIDRLKWDIKYRSGLLGTAADKIIYDTFILDLNIIAGKAVAIN